MCPLCVGTVATVLVGSLSTAGLATLAGLTLWSNPSTQTQDLRGVTR